MPARVFLAIRELTSFTSCGKCCENTVAEETHRLLWNIRRVLLCQDWTALRLPGRGGKRWQLPGQQGSSLCWTNRAGSTRADFTHTFVSIAVWNACRHSVSSILEMPAYTAILRFIRFLWNTNALKRFKTGWLIHVSQTRRVVLWGWTDFCPKGPSWHLARKFKAEWDNQQIWLLQK